jgi:dephospho-CoA kinase
VIGRLNRIHGHYAIANADFLYVLSGFVAEPILWLERYGWRPLTVAEQQALFRFWRHVGRRMGIAELPATLEQLLALNRAVETQLFAAAASNRRVADATLAMLLAGWPTPLHPPLAGLLRGVLPEAVATSLGWPLPPHWLRSGLRLALWTRSRLVNGWQRLRPPRGTHFYSERPTPSYGASFRLEQLGPPALLEQLNRPRWSGPQQRIGLTGSIASGKSTVGRLLAARGLPVLDADVYAREALAAGSPGALAVLERYGERVRGPEAGTVLDRAALGQIVFADPAERRWLEELVHPIVRARFAAELEQLAEAPLVVLMIPLLFEAGLDELCSTIWLVDCDEGQQLRRLMARDQLSEADARARLAAQWPLERKRALADVVLDNRGEPQLLAAQVERALR